MSESEQFCTFLIGEFRCALPVASVLEVHAHQRLTPVPLAPETVAGLLNLRGQILTVLDLRRHVLERSETLSAEPMTLVLDRDGQPVAVLVDTIGDVVRCRSGALLPAPETIPRRLRSLTRAVIHDGDLVTLVFDPAAVANVSDATPSLSRVGGVT